MELPGQAPDTRQRLEPGRRAHGGYSVGQQGKPGKYSEISLDQMTHTSANIWPFMAAVKVSHGRQSGVWGHEGKPD